jgi:hypothetical protein
MAWERGPRILSWGGQAVTPKQAFHRLERMSHGHGGGTSEDYGVVSSLEHVLLGSLTHVPGLVPSAGQEILLRSRRCL